MSILRRSLSVTIHGKLYEIKSYFGTSSVEVHIISTDNTLISQCLVDLNSGLISSVRTFIPYRRMGFSEYLLSYVIKSYNADHLLVAPDNLPAICLYSKLGFKYRKEILLPSEEKAFLMQLDTNS